MTTKISPNHPNKKSPSKPIVKALLTRSTSITPKPKPPLFSDNVLKAFLKDGGSHDSRASAPDTAIGHCNGQISNSDNLVRPPAPSVRRPKSVKGGVKAKQAARAMRAAAKDLPSERKRSRETPAATTALCTHKRPTANAVKLTCNQPKTTKTTKTTLPRKAVDETQTISHRAATKADPVKSPRTTETTQVKMARRHSVRVPMPNGTTLKVSGIRTNDELKFVVVEHGRRRILTPYFAWRQFGGEAIKLLAADGITIVGSSAPVRDAVAQLRRFTPCLVAIQSGWMPGDGFALADGRVIMPDGFPQPLKAFPPSYGMLDRHGCLEAWKQGVAAPLADHMLASFVIMTMFAAALLRLSDRVDNFGFELAGPAGFGKSTIQQLMASAAGRAVGGDGETYWKTCNATMNALEEVMTQYNDMTLILDEAALMPSGARVAARGAEMHGLAFRLTAGRMRQRFGDKPKSRSRMIYLLTTNRPLASLLGAHGAEAEAIADRLMTLPLTNDRKHGIFDSCPPGYASTGEFADALKRTAAEHYGHAVPAFVQWLVQQQHNHPRGLRNWITRHLACFTGKCGADANNGSERRVAEAFGLVYAAGKLAQRAGVLPGSYRPRDAALACYRLHIEQGRAVRSFDDRLRSLINAPDTIDLDKVDAATLSAQQLSACRAFLYTGRSGDRELLIPVMYRDNAFSDWNLIRHDADVERRLKRSRDRATKDRPIVAGWKDPFYCFDISGLEN